MGRRHSEAGSRPLSRRQNEVLRLLLDGSTNEEIAEVLGIGSETVKTYVSQVLAALGARNRFVLAANALARAREVAAVLAQRIDRPLIVSDEAGRISLANRASEALGLRDDLLPRQVRSWLRALLRREGITALCHGSTQSDGCSEAPLRWEIDNVWLEGCHAVLLWRIEPMKVLADGGAPPALPDGGMELPACGRPSPGSSSPSPGRETT